MANVQNRDREEHRFATRLGRLSAKHRRELERLLGSPPDASRVPDSFWRDVQRETEDELVALLLLIFVLAATQHGLERSRAETLGSQFASRRAGEVAAGYTQNGRERLARAGQEWRDRADKGLEVTRSDVQGRLVSIFGPDRAAQVAVSETTAAATAGGEAAVEETVGLDEDDTWFTVRDEKVCPICEPLHGRKRSVWSRAVSLSQGPPAHPGCRCWIHYANEKRGAAVLAG